MEDLSYLDAYIKIGAFVQPDGWSEAGEVRRSDWDKAPFRLFSRRLNLALAVRIERTGRTLRRVPNTGGLWGVRVRITFVGDGEPDTVVGGWVFTRTA